MSIENLLMALPVVLGTILAVTVFRDWLRRRRTQREIAAGLDQRWEPLCKAGKLGNGWEKR